MKNININKNKFGKYQNDILGKLDEGIISEELKEYYEKIKQADIIFFAADNEKNFSDLITITRKLIVEDEKTVIFSSVTILGVNTVILTKESVDLFDKITNNALSSTSKKSIS